MLEQASSHHPEFEGSLPGPGIANPQSVLKDPGMTKEEKRALLASWASDIHAVTDRPALRQLENGAVVGIDDIFDALKLLDADPTSGTKADAAIRYPAHSRRQRLYFRSFQPRRNRRDDDDDDPTPSPVRAPFPKGPIVDTAYAKAVA